MTDKTTYRCHTLNMTHPAHHGLDSGQVRLAHGAGIYLAAPEVDAVLEAHIGQSRPRCSSLSSSYRRSSWSGFTESIAEYDKALNEQERMSLVCED